MGHGWKILTGMSQSVKGKLRMKDGRCWFIPQVLPDALRGLSTHMPAFLQE